MFFYLLIIPALILLGIEIVRYWNILKNDRILFSFCQLRRNILLLLKSKGPAMSDLDYRLLNAISDCVDVTIHEFNEFKSTVFNIRKAKKILLLSKKANSERYIFKPSTNKDIREIQEQLKYIIFRSALAYTPFLRSELILRLLLVVIKQVAKMELKIILSKKRTPKRKAENIVTYLEEYSNDLSWSKRNPKREEMLV